MIVETDWAYLAGILDGDGYFGFIHHRRKNSTLSVSKRGYELESKIHISNMNKRNLEEIQTSLQLGNMTTITYRRENNLSVLGFELRFSPNEQRVILPKIIPYLIQKKKLAQIMLQFLDYRKTKDHKAKVFTENFYLQIEKEFRNAVIEEKPWLLKPQLMSRRLSIQNKNLLKAYVESNPKGEEKKL